MREDCFRTHRKDSNLVTGPEALHVSTFEGCYNATRHLLTGLGSLAMSEKSELPYQA